MPPTDNLYKFIAISGLIAYLFACNMATKQFINYRNEQFELVKDSLENVQLLEESKLKFQFISSELIRKYQLSNECFHAIKYNDCQCCSEHPVKQDELFLRLKIIKTKIDHYNGLNNSLTYKMKDPEFFLNNAVTISYLIIVLSSILISSGFFKWYLKIHYYNMKHLAEREDEEFNSKLKSFLNTPTMQIVGIGLVAIILSFFPILILSFLKN